jgi:hypothetical protein
MANEIHIDYASGNTLYAVIRDVAGNVWYVAGQIFEPWGTAGRTADDYNMSMVDKNGSRYVGDLDANIPADRYSIQTFLQAGADPADSDTLVASEEVVWSGTGRITADKMLANRAVQIKSTGRIEYYDDDGQTILLTHTPGDTDTTLARTPG